MLPRSESALRHIPKQQRSQRRVDQILQSAEAVFSEVGYDHATTNAVAIRAGISIGSLYQFFESKEAILEAMGQRYLDQTQIVMVKLLNDPESTDPRRLMMTLLEALIKLQEQRPYFLQCLGNSHSYDALSSSVNELDAALAKHVRQLLVQYSASATAKELDRRAKICVRIVGSLLPLALEVKGKERQVIINEIVVVLERYLGPELLAKGAQS